MARVYIIAGGAISICYTIDAAVGAGCPNKKDDVLLVQFFLKVISEGPAADRYRPPNQKPITCDGLWGPNSQAYLNRYIAANSAANPNSPLKQDGRVDPVVNGKATGSRTGTLYTILALNDTYSKVRGPAALSDITTDQLFPAPLRPSLKVT
jgi:hypothetical protein